MSKSIFRNNYMTILAHISAWGVFFSIPLFVQRTRAIAPTPNMHEVPIAGITLFFCLMIICFYTNFLVLVPRVLNQFGVRYYLPSVGILWILVMAISSFTRNFIVKGIEEVPFVVLIFPFLLVMAMSLSIRLLKDKTQIERHQKERENETLKSELSFLRSQISPHFLFNIMNNVVALSRVKPEKVEPTLIQLSHLMRYMLYNSDEKKVSIAQEIDYLESYIDLQKLRFGDSVDVYFTKNLKNTEGVLIEPMLLIPFVENAFKHGTGLVEKPIIDIQLSLTDNLLFFNILNKFDPLNVETKDKDSGIGLKNVSRRLDLLYGENQKMNINTEGAVFKVDLRILFNKNIA